MAIEHSLIAEAYLHETKGASTALAGQQLIADGGGSAAWGEANASSSLSTKPSDAMTIATIGTTVKQLLGFARVDANNGCTGNATTDDITIVTGGDYSIDFTISFKVDATGDAGDYQFIITKNNVESNFGAQVTQTAAAEYHTCTVHGILAGLITGDTVEVQVESDEAGDTDDITIAYAQLVVSLMEVTP